MAGDKGCVRPVQRGQRGQRCQRLVDVDIEGDAVLVQNFRGEDASATKQTPPPAIII